MTSPNCLRLIVFENGFRMSIAMSSMINFLKISVNGFELHWLVSVECTWGHASQLNNCQILYVSNYIFWVVSHRCVSLRSPPKCGQWQWYKEMLVMTWKRIYIPSTVWWKSIPKYITVLIVQRFQLACIIEYALSIWWYFWWELSMIVQNVVCGSCAFIVIT